MNGRFAHWAMAIMADAFFEIGREEPKGPDDSGSDRRLKGERPREERIRKSKERKRQMELQPKQYVDPLLQRLLNGAWKAVGEMAEEIKKDEELVQEVFGGAASS